MRSAGEIERYNSLRLKEKHEDDRIEQQLIDLNTKNVNTPAAPAAPVNKTTTITRTVTSMIDKKKVILENGGATIGSSIKSIINHKNIEIETTTTTLTTTHK
jgi:cell division septation protein DedD